MQTCWPTGAIWLVQASRFDLLIVFKTGLFSPCAETCGLGKVDSAKESTGPLYNAATLANLMNSEGESLARPGLVGATEEVQDKVSGVVAGCAIKKQVPCPTANYCIVRSYAQPPALWTTWPTFYKWFYVKYKNSSRRQGYPLHHTRPKLKQTTARLRQGFTARRATRHQWRTLLANRTANRGLCWCCFLPA